MVNCKIIVTCAVTFVISFVSLCLNVAWFMAEDGIDGVDGVHYAHMFFVIFSLTGTIHGGLTEYELIKRCCEWVKWYFIIQAFVMAGIFIITSGLIAKKANVDYTGFKKDYADGKTMVDQCELYSCNLLKGCAAFGFLTAIGYLFEGIFRCCDS